LRAGVSVSPRINVFGEVNGDLVRYDDAGSNDDNRGGDVRAGVEVDFTRLVVGEMSLGYAYRQYENFENEGGLAGDVGITWTPTQLTTVDLVGRAGFEETTVVFEGDEASGNLTTGIGVIVNHDLRRNIRLNANAGYDRDDFQGTNRVDNTFRLGGGVSYLSIGTCRSTPAIGSTPATPTTTTTNSTVTSFAWASPRGSDQSLDAVALGCSSGSGRRLARALRHLHRTGFVFN
jgi:hypothetical protein